ncbi:MAG: divalent-cation tolerance protein CutA [Candidatus Zixiibacteriota bacterium]
MTDPQFIVILTTCATRNEAQTIAQRLVEERCAACVNIVDNVLSVYRWQGKVETGNEALLIIKTRATLAEQVEKTIKTMSSYECPEVIVLPIVGGLPEYLGWVTDQTAGE